MKKFYEKYVSMYGRKLNYDNVDNMYGSLFEDIGELENLGIQGSSDLLKALEDYESKLT